MLFSRFATRNKASRGQRTPAASDRRHISAAFIESLATNASQPSHLAKCHAYAVIVPISQFFADSADRMHRRRLISMAMRCLTERD
jgi:hypothetical protein